MKQYVIIVAGGSGSRMGSDIPKQFLVVGKQPILMHTLQAFEQEGRKLVLVLPKHQVTYWEELCKEYAFTVKHSVVFGGETRFHSVRNGLRSITEKDAIVAVHDGVRPFVSANLIAKAYETAEREGSAITAVALKDSVRENIDGYYQAREREQYRLVQTPQVFRQEWMEQAFEVPYSSLFTDCASVVEAAGFRVTLIEGSYSNIKITTPEDMLYAQVLLGTN